MEICSHAHYIRMITIKHSGVYYSIIIEKNMNKKMNITFHEFSHNSLLGNLISKSIYHPLTLFPSWYIACTFHWSMPFGYEELAGGP